MRETIFIRLLDEGVDVWRPVLGEKGQVNNSFLILASPINVIPNGEKWEFLPGTHVLVKDMLLEGELVKIAYEKVGH